MDGLAQVRAAGLFVWNGRVLVFGTDGIVPAFSFKALGLVLLQVAQFYR